jgi:FkbH-like protein
MELAASVPYSAAVYQRLGISVARAVRRMRVPAKKVLALDCDGTLWGGVLAEDGVQLGDDSAGRSFRALQSQILSLKKQGILLVLVSKNEAEDVWNVLDHNPDMVLRRKDFAAARINWQRKSQNLRELAAELNLGLDSFVLLDDDPVEQMEVEANCPQVTVIPLNPNVERSAILPRLWLFDGIGATHEDSRRHDYVQAETQRNSLKENAGDLQSYLRSLDLKVSMRKAREEDLPRITQLIQKTNQFNLSLRRRSMPDLRALPPEFDTWVVSVRDRFGDYGLVGACISRPANGALDLDSLVVSCRALGRGVEEAFLHGLAQKARAQGTGGLMAHYVEGPRNQPIKIFLTKSGFSPGANGDFRIELSRVSAVPSHLQLEIE